MTYEKSARGDSAKRRAGRSLRLRQNFLLRQTRMHSVDCGGALWQLNRPARRRRNGRARFPKFPKMSQRRRSSQQHRRQNKAKQSHRKLFENPRPDAESPFPPRRRDRGLRNKPIGESLSLSEIGNRAGIRASTRRTSTAGGGRGSRTPSGRIRGRSVSRVCRRTSAAACGRRAGTR
jgi:hypothetical protein